MHYNETNQINITNATPMKKEDAIKDSYTDNVFNFTITGKNNADYSSYGYPDKEAWVSKDTCLIATECTEAASVNRPACETRWDAIIYSTKSALLKEEKIEEDGTDVPIDDEPIVPDTPSDDEKDNTDKDNNDKDVSESPKTGDVLILIAWAVGIGAL